MKPPKINPDIKCAHHFQNISSFVMTNEKSFYSSQNNAVKKISIISIMANSVLLASGSNSSEGSLDHVSVNVKACMNGITLLGCISTEFEKEKKQFAKYYSH